MKNFRHWLTLHCSPDWFCKEVFCFWGWHDFDKLACLNCDFLNPEHRARVKDFER